jgi:SAM-dependent methyltransferase
MADLPMELDAALEGRLAHALDIEGKIPRAFEALGPVADRDVLLLDGVDGGIRAAQLAGLDARVTAGAPDRAAPDHAFDVAISCWRPFLGPDPAAIAEAARVLRPEGRLLVLHDYGRDDVSRLRGDRPEYGLWSRRDGPFLRGGFKIRVLHCFWTFDTIEAGQAFLDDAFGAVGREVGAGMTRPRLTYNVAVYHRTLG